MERPDTLCRTAARIGQLAHTAMIEEVLTTPKPGLVDLYSNGAHTDMDVDTFRRSAAALFPFFTEMAIEGVQETGTPEALFRSIRKTGIEAEKAMYAATGGVNTHKGIIFTFGVFSAAAGRCLREGKEATAKNLAEMQQAMTGRILREELEHMKKRRETDSGFGSSTAEAVKSSSEDMEPTFKTASRKGEKNSAGDSSGCGRASVTHGERNFLRYGTAGIRGEAILGYPGIFRVGLPVLQDGLKRGQEWNLVKLQTLLTLMAQTEDSNVLSRGGLEELERVHAETKEFLRNGGAYQPYAVQILRGMDADYIRRNCSPGGSADLLAASVFINSLTAMRMNGDF
ncbi:MAG: triphosphoribosyl-dephospho-CoA synthase [Blautia sp.]|nr:triphosphoribosyl-dephospho-CoA synthase [Blautia sp.]